MITRIERIVHSISIKANWIAAGALMIMMLLTTLDVVLRMFKTTIPGTYEIIGLLGTVVVSFSLAYTSLEKGHIAVEFLLEKFPPKLAKSIDLINAVIATMLFGAISWQCFVYGLELKQSGQVSMTVQMPTYPFIFGIAVSAFLMCAVLIIRSIQITRGIKNS